MLLLEYEPECKPSAYNNYRNNHDDTRDRTARGFARLNRLSYNRIGLNRLSYNRIGLNRLGYNRLGLNRLGYNRLGLNRLGYNRLSYNRLSYNRFALVYVHIVYI